MLRAILSTSLLVAVSGYWVPKTDQRIVGGEEITIDKRPFQVSMLYNGRHYCGGAIINANSILTAAHCSLNSAASYQFRVGSSSQTSGGVIHEVSQVIVHPYYSAADFEWDVAIMKLAEPIVFNNNAQPIKLAPYGYTVDAGTTLVVSGWGTLSSGGSSPDKLNQVEVPAVDDNVCAAAYGYISERMICAGIGGKDSCQGDSGGPLTHGDLHVGIVSWGRGCALPGYPGVYARTSELRLFIDENM